jgi:NAD(P)-dependent dehydrogenase (short-subunit alcohol dehydrogenase family)
MSRIFITGAADGLGQMAAKLLIADGHKVVLHARNDGRAAEALSAAPGAETALSGDLSSIKETIKLAEDVNKLGHFDAVIHNAGMGYREGSRGNTVDGLPPLFAVNSLAPYILTSLIRLPQRLIYLSSGLHREGNPAMDDLTWDNKRWSSYQAYADTKLHNVLLAFATARYHPQIYANALEPGWVATKMGGSGAPDSLPDAPKTQVWLAVSDSAQALVSGQYFYHQKLKAFHPAAGNHHVQDEFLAACKRLTGITFPIANHS